jgi:hypothetical protein
MRPQAALLANYPVLLCKTKFFIAVNEKYFYISASLGGYRTINPENRLHHN